MNDQLILIGLSLEVEVVSAWRCNKEGLEYWEAKVSLEVYDWYVLCVSDQG